MPAPVTKEVPERVTSVSLTVSDYTWLARYGGIKKGIQRLIKEDREKCLKAKK